MPSCANSTGGASPGGYSDSKGHRAPLRSEVHHSASRTFTTNQPSVTGARPEPKSSRRASGTARVYSGTDDPHALAAGTKAHRVDRAHLAVDVELRAGRQLELDRLPARVMDPRLPGEAAATHAPCAANEGGARPGLEDGDVDEPVGGVGLFELAAAAERARARDDHLPGRPREHLRAVGADVAAQRPR